MPEPNDVRPRAFFIVGHPRSGTNWLSALLNMHPQVCCAGEFHFHAVHNVLPELVSEPHTAAHREPVRTALARAWQEMIRSSLSSVAVLKGGDVQFVGDHSPRLLRFMLPEAAYVPIFRDGRDVVTSLTVHLLNMQNQGPCAETAALFREAMAQCTDDDESLERAADWLLDQEAWVRRWAGVWSRHVLTDLRTIEKFKAGEYPGRVMAVKYEDLHARTQPQVDELLGFLGVDPARSPRIESSSDPRTRPGFSENKASSHYRRGKVGDWREHFTPRTCAWFQEAGGEGLRALGYERDGQWVGGGGGGR